MVQSLLIMAQKAATLGQTSLVSLWQSVKELPGGALSGFEATMLGRASRHPTSCVVSGVSNMALILIAWNSSLQK